MFFAETTAPFLHGYQHLEIEKSFTSFALGVCIYICIDFLWKLSLSALTIDMYVFIYTRASVCGARKRAIYSAISGIAAHNTPVA